MLHVHIVYQYWPDMKRQGACCSRWCLDVASEAERDFQSTSPNNSQEAGPVGRTGHATREEHLLAARQITQHTACSDSGSLISAGNGLYLEKLIIDEDAASVEGPPTPDNEESGRVSMPATKRQRISSTSPSTLAASFARGLFLI